MFDRRKVLGRGVRGGDAPFPEEEAARGNQAASYMQILSLATMHLLHLLLYFALHSAAILHCTCKSSNTLILGDMLRTMQYHPLHFLCKSFYFVFASFFCTCNMQFYEHFAFFWEDVNTFFRTKSYTVDPPPSPPQLTYTKDSANEFSQKRWFLTPKIGL